MAHDDQPLNSLEQTLIELQTVTQGVEKKIASLNTAVRGLKGGLESWNERLGDADALLLKVEEINQRVLQVEGEARQKLDALEQGLDQRFSTLMQTLDDHHQALVKRAEAAFERMADRVERLAEAMVGFAEDLETRAQPFFGSREEALQAIQGWLDGLTSKIAPLTDRVEQLHLRMDAAVGQISEQRQELLDSIGGLIDRLERQSEEMLHGLKAEADGASERYLAEFQDALNQVVRRWRETVLRPLDRERDETLSQFEASLTETVCMLREELRRFEENWRRSLDRLRSTPSDLEEASARTILDWQDASKSEREDIRVLWRNELNTLRLDFAAFRKLLEREKDRLLRELWKRDAPPSDESSGGNAGF
ncbi:MAG: hypothetical protein WHU10_08445 [Fimbriimonadales bacterium]